jgi:hypothetical protein
MNDIERLIELIDTRYAGSQAAFARAISRKPAQVNQYLKGRRKLGIEVKMYIEECLGISGWFGLSHSTPNIKFTGPEAAEEPIVSALLTLDGHLKALAPVFQDSGREVLRKWAIGIASTQEVADALYAMSLASASLGKKKD